MVAEFREVSCKDIWYESESVYTITAVPNGFNICKLLLVKPLQIAWMFWIMNILDFKVIINKK